MKRREFMRQSALVAGAAPVWASSWGSLFAQRAAAGAAAAAGAGKTAAAQAAPIQALLPRDKSGHQFVLYSDCTSGRVESKEPIEALAKINAVVQRLTPAPEFISFPGDAVAIGSDAREWEYWYNVEMKWVRDRGLTLYQSTSNHNTNSYIGEANFRKYHPELPQNGPGDQKGLAYWVRRGNLLYISLHHPLGPTAEYRDGFDFADLQWADEVLAANADAEYKLVAAHYPVFRINGYTGMSIPREDWEPFWAVLRKHGVDAYLTSHVLAFDVQVRDGILQICSGGAGPETMPEATEGTHAVQIAMDRQGVRYQVLATDGRVRESLVWPLLPPEDLSYSTDKKAWAPMDSGASVPVAASPASRVAVYCFTGLSFFAEPEQQRIDLLRGARGGETVFAAWVDLLSGRLYVSIHIEQVGLQHWMGPVLDFRKGPVSVDLALHPGMGPGGVLWRRNAGSPWNSMETTSAHGLEAARWPEAVAKVAVTRDVGGKPVETKFTVQRTEMALPSLDGTPTSTAL